MNICDENIDSRQLALLKHWNIRFSVIGYGIAKLGAKDFEIIPQLHHLRRPTFFTSDRGFYRKDFCHPRYCVVCLDVSQEDAAVYVKRFLAQPEFKLWASRKGKVVRYAPSGIHFWQFKMQTEQRIDW